MEEFAEFLERIDHPKHRARMEELLTRVMARFPHLVPVIKWNQPMFTDHGTYIIGFSVSKKHMAISPERAGMIALSDEISKSGYEYTKELVRIPWEQPIDFLLLDKMIEFNLTDKADCTNFWR